MSGYEEREAVRIRNDQNPPQMGAIHYNLLQINFIASKHNIYCSAFKSQITIIYCNILFTIFKHSTILPTPGTSNNTPTAAAVTIWR
jgi:hypothetical protein